MTLEATSEVAVLEVPMTINFYDGEDFAKQEYAHIEIPEDLRHFIMQVDHDSLGEEWKEFCDTSVLPELFDSVIHGVAEMDNQEEEFTFNTGYLVWGYGEKQFQLRLECIDVKGNDGGPLSDGLPGVAVFQDMGCYTVVASVKLGEKEDYLDGSDSDSEPNEEDEIEFDD